MSYINCMKVRKFWLIVKFDLALTASILTGLLDTGCADFLCFPDACHADILCLPDAGHADTLCLPDAGHANLLCHGRLLPALLSGERGEARELAVDWNINEGWLFWLINYTVQYFDFQLSVICQNRDLCIFCLIPLETSSDWYLNAYLGLFWDLSI